MMKSKKHILFSFILTTLATSLIGCSSSASTEKASETINSLLDHYTDSETSISTNIVSDTPVEVIEILTYVPECTGTAVSETDSISIDYSNASEGYIMVKYLGDHSGKIKFQVTGPDGLTYTYDLTVGDDYQTFPLTGGSGSYTLNSYEQDSGTNYYAIGSTTIDVELVNDFTTYLYPNRFVNYTQDSTVVQLSIEAASDVYSEIDLISNIYYAAMDTLDYDSDKATEASASGTLTSFIPDLEEAISTGKGICFDYASLMVAMLRIQELPAKLVIGYAGEAYHAWISVYTEEYGWIDDVITFDGSNWTLMDPTFADNTANTSALNEFIGDGTNYTEKYVY